MKFNLFWNSLLTTLTALFQSIGLYSQLEKLEGKAETLKAEHKARKESRDSFIKLLCERVHAAFGHLAGQVEVVKFDENRSVQIESHSAIVDSTRGMLDKLFGGSLNNDWDKHQTPDKRGNLPSVGSTIFKSDNGQTLEQSHSGEALKIEAKLSYTARDIEGKIENAFTALLATLELSGRNKFAKAKAELQAVADLFSLDSEEVDALLFHAEKAYEANRLANMVKSTNSEIQSLTGKKGISKSVAEKLTLYCGKDAIAVIEQEVAFTRQTALTKGIGADYSEAKNAANRSVLQYAGSKLQWDWMECDNIAIKTQTELKVKATAEASAEKADTQMKDAVKLRTGKKTTTAQAVA